MPSRFMVSWVARAVGMTRASPAASISASTSVAMASISGTMMCGASARMTPFRTWASVIGMTRLRWATCIAGALA